MFAAQETALGGWIVRTIGIVRARVKIAELGLHHSPPAPEGPRRTLDEEPRQEGTSNNAGFRRVIGYAQGDRRMRWSPLKASGNGRHAVKTGAAAGGSPRIEKTQLSHPRLCESCHHA
jgi:hypothetical protein